VTADEQAREIAKAIMQESDGEMWVVYAKVGALLRVPGKDTTGTAL
jgi:hypothetical protein